MLQNKISVVIKSQQNAASVLNTIAARNKFGATSSIGGAFKQHSKNGVSIFSYALPIHAEYGALIKLISSKCDMQGVKLNFCDNTVNTDIIPKVKIVHKDTEIEEFKIQTNISTSTDVKKLLSDFSTEHPSENYSINGIISLFFIFQKVTDMQKLHKVYDKIPYGDSFIINESQSTYMSPCKTTAQIISGAKQVTKTDLASLTEFDDVSDLLKAQFQTQLENNLLLRNSIIGMELVLIANTEGQPSTTKRFPICYKVIPSATQENYETNQIISQICL